MASPGNDPDSLSEGKSPTDSSVKRETLTSRAKRIIGRTLDSPKKVGSPPDSDKSSKGTSKKAPDRRREQVLQAQRQVPLVLFVAFSHLHPLRTHRQRTQGYIRELEKEVLRLREREAEVEQKNAEILKKARALEQTLITNNVPVPDELTSASTATSPPFGFGNDFALHSPFLSTEASNPSEGATPAPPTSDSEAGPSDPYVHVDFTSHQGQGLQHITNHRSYLDDPVTFEPPAIPTARPERAESSRSAAFPSLASQQALDFVLELERICFPHIEFEQLNPNLVQGDIPEDNYGSSHVYTATANLLNHAHHQHSPVASCPMYEPFSYPKPDLSAMFNSSLHVNFGTDVTPIQVWANLLHISELGYVISPDFVAIMLDELKRYVRCNGFGAVVEKITINELIQFYFPGQAYVDPQVVAAMKFRITFGPTSLARSHIVIARVWSPKRLTTCIEELLPLDDFNKSAGLDFVYRVGAAEAWRFSVLISKPDLKVIASTLISSAPWISPVLPKQAQESKHSGCHCFFHGTIPSPRYCRNCVQKV
ncbi:hypothetical protein BT63DRAFT_463274 [Microthyrium microscopicum]|uniref:BZIP domain-containing protein n=1 Tax=Microthyrium microscopicum TaxID=703497 RepID=A0A6A6U2I2_9PEZI|nr:hypothetical protein BT63DRAFT_463274 [Microthyrium microscopicum]